MQIIRTAATLTVVQLWFDDGATEEKFTVCFGPVLNMLILRTVGNKFQRLGHSR